MFNYQCKICMNDACVSFGGPLAWILSIDGVHQRVLAIFYSIFVVLIVMPAYLIYTLIMGHQMPVNLNLSWEITYVNERRTRGDSDHPELD